MPNETDSKVKRFPRPIIIAGLVYGFSFLGWLFLLGWLMLSLVPADAPVTYLLLCMYPPVVIGCIVYGWILYRRDSAETGRYILLLPLVEGLLAIAAFAALLYS